MIAPKTWDGKYATQLQQENARLRVQIQRLELQVHFLECPLPPDAGCSQCRQYAEIHLREAR